MAQQSGAGVLLFVAVIFAGVYLTRDASLNQQAPGFSLPETYGGRVDFESCRGRPVLLVVGLPLALDGGEHRLTGLARKFAQRLRGRFGNYIPPVLEALGLAEVEHNARNNRMRAI